MSKAQPPVMTDVAVVPARHDPSRHKFKRDPNARLAAPRLFMSAKTISAIPVYRADLYDALIQISLDARVRSIELSTDGIPVPTPGAVVVVTDNGRFGLDLGPEEPAAKPHGVSARSGLPPYLPAADVALEPRRSNARLLWAYRTQPVALALRMQILGLLADGPLPLRDLLPAIRTHADPAAAVFALACQDLIELDLLTTPVGPSTIVRSRT
jgi:hypothetical protein